MAWYDFYFDLEPSDQFFNVFIDQQINICHKNWNQLTKYGLHIRICIVWFCNRQIQKKTQLPKHNIDDKNLIKLFNSDGVECIQKSMKFYNYLYSVCSKIDK